MTNDFAAQAALYNNLYRHLQEAIIDEQRLNSYLDNLNIPSGNHVRILVQIAVMELKENMDRLIAGLNLENQFLFMGREIRGFSDALYVISELKLSIIGQLRQRGISGQCQYITRLIDSCTDFAAIGMGNLKGPQDEKKRPITFNKVPRPLLFTLIYP